MKKFFLFSSFILFSIISFAQNVHYNTDTSSHHFLRNFKQQKIGTVSGTIVDSVTKKPMANATIYLYNELNDTITHAPKELLAGASITKGDGSFEINNVLSPARIRVHVSVVGYADYTKNIIVSPRTDNAVDIGNALMQQENGNLKTVTVTTTTPFMQMGVDKKIFNVSQSLLSSGQTAQEVLAQIPSVSVDIDGNISVRGASPQIYVDGMPTTLTVDQIPSDIIDKVELITNPSAKYDASTGGGGIIDIVLKKNSNIGYNGGINGGSDTRGAWNLGTDLNVRVGKFNIFARANHRERNQSQQNNLSRTDYLTDKNNNNIDEKDSIYQQGKTANKGAFTFVNLGTDFNLNKKNIFTISGTYVKGTFSGKQPQTIDSMFTNEPTIYDSLFSRSKFEFKNFQGEFKYRHNFSSDGNHNLLFDMTYNHATTDNNSAISTTTFSDPNYSNLLTNQLRSAYGSGGNKNWVFQADYTNPITENSKIEAGARAQIRNTISSSYQYLMNANSDIPIDYNFPQNYPQYLDSLASSNYSYRDEVFAVYGIFSSKIGEKFSYSLGTRIENSNYKGTDFTIPENVATNFKVKYPVELFPSAFVTYNLAEGEDLQMNYSRKVSRPNFFQLLPIYNYSDPYNIEVGNPNLHPQFTSQYELIYDKSYSPGGTFLGSIYYRHSTNLITSYQYKDSSIVDTPIVNSYANAQSSSTYGLELDNRINIAKIWDADLNFNLFNNIINSGDSLGGGQNKRWSWFAKWNNNFKLPHSITLELNAQYYSKSILPNSGSGAVQGGGGGNGGGGGGLGGSNIGTSQGYIASRANVSAAIRKDWHWGKGNTLSFTASINDIFATNRNIAYTVTPFMTQTQYRLAQPRIVRFTLSYRFGRMDKSLFKKNNQQQDNNNDNDIAPMGMSN